MPAKRRTNKRVRPASLDDASPASRQPKKRSTRTEITASKYFTTATNEPGLTRNAFEDKTNLKTTNTYDKHPFPENDILGQIYRKKMTCHSSIQSSSGVEVRNPLSERSSNLLHYYSRVSLGLPCRPKLKMTVQEPVRNLVSHMQLYRTASPFDRRGTVLEWHPTQHRLLTVASKGGDVILWDPDCTGLEELSLHGSGAGGSINAMKFQDNEHLVTSCLDGTVTCHDLTGRETKILLDTGNCYDFWYCSLDVNHRRHMMVAGDNVGNVTLVDNKGKKLFEFRLHKDKVTHTEFSPREDWLLCTASTDRTVKVWDVRMVKDRKSALYTMEHEKPINSAYFSLTDGTRLLTTDQHHEIRVYGLPDFHLEQKISHPHRFFRHMTPIKASWHPLQDLIVVGRYPDEKSPDYRPDEKRTIDFLDAETGKMWCQLQAPGLNGICQLNKFNHAGDRLASTMGQNILLWTREEEVIEKQQRLLDQFKQQGQHSNSSQDGQQRNPGSRDGSSSRGRNKSTKDAKGKTKGKVQTKVSVKTKEKKR